MRPVFVKVGCPPSGASGSDTTMLLSSKFSSYMEKHGPKKKIARRCVSQNNEDVIACLQVLDSVVDFAFGTHTKKSACKNRNSFPRYEAHVWPRNQLESNFVGENKRRFDRREEKLERRKSRSRKLLRTDQSEVFGVSEGHNGQKQAPAEKMARRDGFSRLKFTRGTKRGASPGKSPDPHTDKVSVVNLAAFFFLTSQSTIPVSAELLVRKWERSRY